MEANKFNYSNSGNLDSMSHHHSDSDFVNLNVSTDSGNVNFMNHILNNDAQLNSENFEMNLEEIIDMPFDPNEKIDLDCIISDMFFSYSLKKKNLMGQKKLLKIHFWPIFFYDTLITNTGKLKRFILVIFFFKELENNIDVSFYILLDLTNILKNVK